MKKIVNKLKRSLLYPIISIIGLTILISTSCDSDYVEKDIMSAQSQSKTDQVFANTDILMSVESNTLIFNSEEDFQKAIDLLNSLGDESLNDWENFCGFSSLLNSKKYELVQHKTDKLFASLLNNESEVIVGKHKFTINFDNEKVVVEYIIDESKSSLDLKSSDLLVGEFDFTDDVFTLLEDGIKEIKGTYCGGRVDDHSFPFYGMSGDNIYCRVKYYTIGIYNTISIKMDQNFYYFDGYAPLKNGFYTNYGESTWENKKDSGTFNNISEEKETPSYGDISVRPYARTRRLKSFYLNVEFYTECTWNTTYNYEISVDINCH